MPSFIKRIVISISRPEYLDRLFGGFVFRIGIDVGGTFTDFAVSRDTGSLRFFKSPSTPHDPSEGVTISLSEVASVYHLSIEQLLHETEMIIHGTTVATNALVERKGAKLGLLTTEGFRDLLEMREGMKEDRYNLRMKQVEPLVPRYLRLGIPERVRSDGSVETSLDKDAVERAIDALIEEGVESLAVCLLFSYANPAHEQIVGELIRNKLPDVYTSLSHQILPQIKEFDRVSTTVVNAYVGPVLDRYLLQLQERFDALGEPKKILIMQSNGGVASVEDSARQAVRAILSGPAGGVTGAAFQGEHIGEPKVIGIDMGGTSTDISLIVNGTPHITTERYEGGWKICRPHDRYSNPGCWWRKHCVGRSWRHIASGAGKCWGQPRSRLLRQGWNKPYSDRCKPRFKLPRPEELPGRKNLFGSELSGDSYRGANRLTS